MLPISRLGRRRRPLRHGFTLVELLVVIGILALLVALLLPAINSAREAGRRTTCATNLTRLALAASQFNSDLGYLPGWRNTTKVNNTASSTGWLVPLLPFVERKDVATAIVSGNSAEVGKVQMGLTLCPSLPPPASGYNPTRLDYGCNAGSGGGSDRLKSETPPTPNKNDGALADNVGGFFNSAQDISEGDGLSLTLLLSEATHGNWRWSSVVAGTGFGVANNVYFRNDQAFSFKPNPGLAAGMKLLNSGDVSYPSSKHSGGVVAAFADGRVTFLKDTIAPYVFGHLLTSRSAWSPSARRYTTNTNMANVFLTAPPAPLPYDMKLDDF